MARAGTNFLPHPIKRLFTAVSVAGTLALAACSAGAPLPFMSERIVLNCPDYFILEDAAILTKFRDGPGRDITDIEFRSEMADIKLACLSEIDEDTNSGHMEVDVTPILAAELGPANPGEAATLPYFIVVTNPDKHIVYREEFSFPISFKGNKTRLIASVEPITLNLPITPEIRNTYYLIYGGFVLTESQLEYNRKQIQDRLQ